MRVEKDFEDILGLLNKHKVKYCIIGAFAVGFYAKPRYTKDIDILVEPSLKNGKKIINTLDEYGFNFPNLTEKDFSRKGTIVQLGYEPLRVDLITSIKGLEFDEVWKNRKVGEYGRHRVYFIGLRELIKNKKMLTRPLDRIDLEILQRGLKLTHGTRSSKA